MSVIRIEKRNGREPSRFHRACLVVALVLVAAGWGLRPASVVAQAPQAAAQATVVLEGELDVLYEDRDDGSRLLHFLNTDTGRVPLRFQGDAPDLPTGSRIRVSGNLAEGTLTTTSVTTIAVSPTRTLGDQDVLVILFNFANNTAQPFAPTSIGGVNNQVRNFYLENSYGQTSMNFTVVDRWLTIEANSSPCSYSTWASQADKAALSVGYDVTTYDRLVYAFPSNSACSWWGMGNVAGPRSYINGSYGTRVVAHEQGHNFGNHHSHALKCDSIGCVSVNYGDDRDVLGAPGVIGHLNAFQKERLGWLNYGISPAIQTVSTTANYWIEAYETGTGIHPKGLKIWNPNTGTYYYVEVRTNAGTFDVASGVTIHTGSPTKSDSSYQRDLAPLSTTWDSTLDVNQTFVDETIGLSITTLPADTTTTLPADSVGALVMVAFEPLPCVTQTPTVSISPSGTLWGRTDTALNYSVTVTNNDSTSCGSSDFTLGAAVPSGWLSPFTPASLASLAPGASASAALAVTAEANSSGTYSFTVSAVNGNSTYTGYATTSVVVASKLDVTVIASQSTSKGGSSINMSATVMIGHLAVPGASVTFTLRRPTPEDGTTTLSGTTDSNGKVAVSYKLNKRKDPSGSYKVTADANKNGILGTNVSNDLTVVY